MFRVSAAVRTALGAAASLVLFVSCADNSSHPTAYESSNASPSFALSVSSSNFQQCANGDNGGEPCFYINGVLNDSKSLYRESDVIAERFVIPGLTVGHTYRLVFDYGWEKAVSTGHMNYDFLAGWNTTLGPLANPCGDPLGNGASDIRVICNADGTIKPAYSASAAFQVVPDEIFTTNAPLGLGTELQAAIDRFQTTNGADAVRVDILGGTFPASAFDNVTYNVNGDDVNGRFTVRFTATQTSVMLLWGGHFADSRDYRLAVWDDDKTASTAEAQGNLTGAAGQTGAPFHFTQQYLKNLDSGDSTGIGSLSNNVQGNVLEPLPEASITIAASDTNGVGEPHTFTVTVIKDADDGAGTVPAAGEHVDVTLAASGGAVPVVDAAASTCDNAGANTDSNGQCTITFTSNTAGSVTGSATSTLLFGTTSLTVSTDGSGDNSAPVVKVFLSGTIRWLKHDGLGQLLGGAVFTLCRTHDWNSDANSYTDVADVCVDVTDNAATDGDADDTPGVFEVSGLVLGKYTVKEKTPPPGYILDPDTENADLSTSVTFVTIMTAFVNISPDAFITIGPALDTNSVSESHTFTATMTAVPNGGSPVSVADFVITVSPAPSTPGTTTCGEFNAETNSKTCTITINSNAAGTFTANASATATVAGVSMTRDTDPATAEIGAGPGGSGPAVKVYVAPLLSITKTPDLASDAGGTVHPGGTASFTITVSNSAAVGTGTAHGVTMTDTLPAGLSWSDNKAECTITQVSVDGVSRDKVSCDIGSLAPGASFSVVVSATIPPSGFLQVDPAPAGTSLEIDGNLTDEAGGGADWATLPASLFSCMSNPKIGCDIDLPTGSSDNSFGQGSKEDSPSPTVVTGSIPNNKSDLKRFYVSKQRFMTTDYLYLAWSRVQDPNGTTNMDFEFNQSTQLSANGVTPVRTAGDILIKYDLSRGGSVPTLGFHRWVTAASAGGQTPAQVCEATNAFPCWDKVTPLTTDVAGAINSATISEPVAGGTLDARTFGEASINLQASGIFSPGVCTFFGSAYLKSRSSDSFVSELKDFIAPIPVNLTNCEPKVLDNTAWASATNFAPTGGNIGDAISDTGRIIVTESQTASLGVSSNNVHLAMLPGRRKDSLLDSAELN